MTGNSLFASNQFKYTYSLKSLYIYTINSADIINLLLIKKKLIKRKSSNLQIPKNFYFILIQYRHSISLKIFISFRLFGL